MPAGGVIEAIGISAGGADTGLVDPAFKQLDICRISSSSMRAARVPPPYENAARELGIARGDHFDLPGAQCLPNRYGLLV